MRTRASGRPRYMTSQEANLARAYQELNGTGATPATTWGMTAEEFAAIVRQVEKERAA